MTQTARKRDKVALDERGTSKHMYGRKTILSVDPKHGSWLNLIEVFFSKLARTLLREIRVNSKAELKERIEMYLARLNGTPVTFRWKYGPR